MPRYLRFVAVVPAALMLSAGSLRAQARAVMQGEVVDVVSGAAVAAARVLVDNRPRAQADSQGRFVVAGLSVGEHRVRVERLGYSPAEVVAVVADSMYLTVSMQPEARMLPVVDVIAEPMPPDSSPLHGFEMRRRYRGGGEFITRRDLDRMPHATLVEVLRGLTGAKVIHAASGSGDYLATVTAPGAESLNRPDGACYARVFVDGNQISGIDHGGAPDLNELDVDEVHGIEFYALSANAPPEFRTLSWDCGTLILWSRPAP